MGRLHNFDEDFPLSWPEHPPEVERTEYTTGGGKPKGGAGSRGGAEDDRRILLVDCDMFFVQVARLADPDGAGATPYLLVGGSATGRGVVTSASYDARPYGVRSGMSTARALRLCPAATVVPVPREECGRRSRMVRRSLEALAPVVEAASVDEFYLDLTGTERLFGGESLAETARRIRRRILEETEISVSVGGGTRKLVAKLAAEVAKPGGVHVVPAGGEERFVRGCELSRIPGIGPTLLAELEKRGLRSPDDVLAVEERWLEEWVGPRRAHWLRERLRGVDPSPVLPRGERKSVSAERTFHEDLTDRGTLGSHLQRLVLSVGRDLRSRGVRARTVTVKIRTRDFRTRTAARTLSEAVESDGALAAAARSLLQELLGRIRGPVRLLGMGASNLTREGDAAQIPLLPREADESPRERAVSRIMDDLRNRFGDEALFPAGIIPPGPTTSRPGKGDGEKP